MNKKGKIRTEKRKDRQIYSTTGWKYKIKKKKRKKNSMKIDSRVTKSYN